MRDEILSKIDELKSDMINDIIDIVKIKSVEEPESEGAPFGKGTADALEKALSISKKLGFNIKNMDNYIGYASYGNSDDYVCAIGHLDVVPEGEGWKNPPYSGFVKDGIIYSRGILDNKGPIMSCLYAAYALKELNIPLSKEIRIIFGLDEESGFEDLRYYLSKENPPCSGFTPDCKYPVVYAERGRASIEVASKDEDKLFDFINKYIFNASSTGDRLGIDYKNDEFGIMEMRGYNIKKKDNDFIFSFNLSYPAGLDIDETINVISERAIDMEVRLTNDFKPVYFDKDSEMIKSMQEAYEYVTGNDGTPVTTTGGTYAKLMPNIVPFGPSFPGQKGIGHNPNEWMSIDDIITNAKIYALALYNLAR